MKDHCTCWFRRRDRKFEPEALVRFSTGILVVILLLIAFPVQAEPLHHAARVGDVDQAKQLIAQGADVNATLNTGVTALFLASRWGHSEIVALLLSNGANVNAKTKTGRSALYIASDQGHDDIVKRLLSAGADVNAIHNDGRTAFQVAKLLGHREVVEVLRIAKTQADRVPEPAEHGCALGPCRVWIQLDSIPQAGRQNSGELSQMHDASYGRDAD